MKKEIRSLTGLRGIAASLVAVYHFSGSVQISSRIGVMVAHGYLWVDMFFVLSGFILAHTYGRRFAGRFQIRTLLVFLGMRIARIWPLYALVTAETAAMKLLHPASAEVPALPLTLLSNLLMIQAWGVAPSLEGAAWSISTEWAAYLLFPALVAYTLFSKAGAALATGLCALAVLVALAATPGPYSFAWEARTGPLDIYSAATVAPLLRCLPEFMLGLLAYRAATALTTRRTRWEGCIAPGAAAVIVFCMGVPNCDLAVVATFPVLIIGLFLKGGLVGRCLGSAGPYLLGELSFAIYLVHDKFRQFHQSVEHVAGAVLPWPWLWAAAATAAAVLFCAAALHIAVERPCRRVLHRLVDRALLAPAAQHLRPLPAADEPARQTVTELPGPLQRGYLK